MFQRVVDLLLRFMLFLVPLTALAVLGFVAASFVSAQMADVPVAPKVALLDAAADQPINLSPESIERRVIDLYLRTQGDQINTPLDATAEVRIFTIESGETALTVATRLEAEGLIGDAGLFRRYMAQNGIDQRLAAGDFEISASMSMAEIADRLQRARYEEIVLTVPEGMRAEEVAELLDVKGVMDGSEFLAMVQGGAAAANALGDYDWLPAGLTTLEGYLFPDTYRLPVPARPSDLIVRMLDNFEGRVDDEMLAPARQAGRGLEQVIIMASIVEREAPRARACIGTARAARAARRPAGPTCRQTRRCSMPRAARASGGGSRHRWRPMPRCSPPTTRICGPAFRPRRSRARASRPSRPRSSRLRRSTASSSPRETAAMSLRRPWPNTRPTSRPISSRP